MSLLNSRQENLEALALLPCLDRFQLLWSLSVILSSFRLPWPSRTKILMHDSLTLRWHTVFPFPTRFWPLPI